jgi:putative ABC transport system permease protein
MAWRNLSRRKLRTSLTVAGIIVGVALILVLLSLVAGIDVQVRTSIRALGGADIVVYNATIVNARQSFFLGSSATLNESMVEEIASLPNVYAVSPQVTEVVVVNDTLAPVWGIEPKTYDDATGGLNIVEGKTIDENETNVTVLGKALLDVFNASLGQQILVNARPPNQENNVTLTIIGVYETGVSVTDRGIYVPISVAQNLTGSYGKVTSILVKADDPNNAATVSSEIITLFPETRVVAMSTITERTSQLLNTVAVFLGALGIVALVAGSFGVINTMLISVVERTREIGTMKAIGAKNSTVLKVFISEALLLGCLGGIVGVVIGGLSSLVVSRLSIDILPTAGNVSPLLTLPNIAISFFLGLATGVVAGLYPAWRAARMKPVEALRHV